MRVPFELCEGTFGRNASNSTSLACKRKMCVSTHNKLQIQNLGSIARYTETI